MTNLNTSFSLETVVLCDPKSGAPLAASQSANTLNYEPGVEIMPILGNDGIPVDAGAGNASSSLTLELRELSAISLAIDVGAEGEIEPKEIPAIASKAEALNSASADFAQAISISAPGELATNELILIANSATEIEVFSLSDLGPRTKSQFSLGKFVVTPAQAVTIDLTANLGVTITVDAAYTVKEADSVWLSLFPAGSRTIESSPFANGTELSKFRIIGITEKTAEGEQTLVVLPKVVFAQPFTLSLSNKEVATYSLTGIALAGDNGVSPFSWRHLSAS